MPVIDVTKNIEERTLTITAEFAAPVERVWELYADPRQLEQVWGPPSHPATFVDHDLTEGGRVTYFMTGPDGEKYYGYWEIDTVSEPSGFTFRDGFANDDFTANTDLPESRNVYAFTAAGDGTRAVYSGTYASAEALQQVLDMGMEEGARSSINQIDEFLSKATA